MNRRISHIPAFDGIRGLAIVLVLFFHSGLIINGSSSTEKFWLRIVSFGWAGVDLFFVLSGFLITTILIQSRESRSYFRNFFARRALRIFPLYFASLSVLYIYRFANPEFQWWYWLFLQNWIPIINGAPQPIAMQPYWSLAVEEQFYLLWPFVVYFLKPSQLKWFCSSSILLALALRFFAKNYNIDPWAITVTTPFRLDALALGGLISSLSISLDKRQLKNLGWLFVVLGGLGVIAIAFYENGYRIDGFWSQTFGYTFFASMCAGLLAVIISNDERPPVLFKLFESKVLQHLGNRSYAIYVMHMPILVILAILYQKKFALKDKSGTMDTQCYLIAVVICLILAELSWHLFEKHFLKLKKFFPRNSADPAITAKDVN